jgi:hypothetical protein
MTYDFNSLLHIARPDYVPPAQLLYQSLNQDMPYWMRPKFEAGLRKAMKPDQEARNVLALLAAEEKQHEHSSFSGPSSNKASSNKEWHNGI